MDEFWALNGLEFRLIVEGHTEKKKSFHREFAWLASTLLQAWVKNAPSMKRLLGEGTSDFSTPEDMEQYLEQQRKKREAAESKEKAKWRPSWAR